MALLPAGPGPRPPRPEEPIARECVEGYLFSRPPTELLIFRRPPARGSIWVPISGKVDPTDADLDAALARELEEETGLVHPLRIDPLDWHVPFRADNGEVWRLHAYAVEIPRSFLPRLSAEHVQFEWVGLDEAERRLDYPDNREAVGRLREFLRWGSPKV
ncbi:MAG TPA: NUDIX domain-containing protein [Thermoplasmata archaeon]|nr:NUDIX domain-containing protein [Thermoplasmata archaeon]